MTFSQKHLNADETIALDMHPHWWFFAEPAFTVLGVIILAIIALAKGPSGTAGDATNVVIIALLVASALWLLHRYLQWVTTHFVITSQRVIFRTGIIAKSGIQIPLERVNNVNFHQSVFERVLGAGDLLIESAGEDGQSRYTDIRHPDRVQALIHSQMETQANRRTSAPFAAPQNAAPANVDVADQLERLEGMLSRGTLTQAEFDAQKRKLLGL